VLPHRLHHPADRRDPELLHRQRTRAAAGYSLENFGGKEFIGSLVASRWRELGPVMVAVLVAGRVGSAIAAELASMKVYQEIDALETMNIPPARMLVMPRLAAIVVMMPVLAIIANLVAGSAAPSFPNIPCPSTSSPRNTSIPSGGSPSSRT